MSCGSVVDGPRLAECVARKRGVSFEIAARVFLDEKRIEKYDARNSKIGEDRYQAIGMVEEVLFVAFTEKSADRIRIISARAAEQEEIDEYFENYDA